MLLLRTLRLHPPVNVVSHQGEVEEVEMEVVEGEEREVQEKEKEVEEEEEEVARQFYHIKRTNHSTLMAVL